MWSLCFSFPVFCICLCSFSESMYVFASCFLNITKFEFIIEVKVNVNVSWHAEKVNKFKLRVNMTNFLIIKYISL